jgi:hypothetical protein
MELSAEMHASNTHELRVDFRIARFLNKVTDYANLL